MPPNLLVPLEDTEIRDGSLVVKASAALGERERAFFDRYQQDFSWGAGVFEDLWQAQLEWSQLPQDVQDTLREIARIDPAHFSEPSEELCYKRYLLTRQIAYGKAPILMPVAELISHSGKVEGFDLRDVVAVSGMFDEEVLVNYSTDDCWGRAVYYGFCEAEHYALSLPLSLKFEDCRIEILRSLDRTERFNGFPVPTMRVEDDTVCFSYLMLGNARAPRLPRAVFLHVTKNTPIKRPDEMFDIIQHHNRMQLLKFLCVSEGHSTPLTAMLRSAAYAQLETLSKHWGTRSLAAGSGNP